MADKRIRVLAIFALALANRLAADPPPKPTVDELVREIQGILAEHEIPGVGLALVAKDEVLWAGGIGKAEVASGRPVTADTQFRVGSLSKSFIALTLLKLQEEGRVDLNARLADVIPEIPISNPYEGRTPLRVIHLLEHTAGLDDIHYNELVLPGTAPAPSLRQLLSAHPQARKVRWEPGTRASYSNPGYAVAGYVIEKLAGKPFEDYVKEALLDPIGMTTSTFRETEIRQAEMARGYRGRELAVVPRFYLRPAGALVSSAREMALFLRFLLNRGEAGGRRVLSEKSLTEMETVHTTLAAQAGLANGYGLGNEVDLQFPLKTRGHDGGLPGYSAHYRYLKDYGVGYAILFNTAGAYPGRQKIHRAVFDFISRGIASPRPPRAEPRGQQLSGLAGYYERANPGDQLLAFQDALFGGVHVRLRDGKLFRQAFRQSEEELIPVSGMLFRMKDESDASVVFTADSAGRRVMVADTGWSYYQKAEAWKVYLHRGCVLAALALMLSSVLFALVWMPLAVLRRAGTWTQLGPRLVSLLSALSFLAWAVLFVSRGPLELATANPVTATLFALSLLFAALSFYGLFLSLRGLSLPMRLGVRVHTLAVSLANCGVTLYLAWWGLLGLRTWSW